MEEDRETARTLIRRTLGDSRKGRPVTTGLPGDLLKQSVKRLRVLALLYALTFFLADFFGYVLEPSNKIDSVDDWLPGVVSIVAALAVAWITTRPALHPAMILRVGLTFEVLGSFGIAMA